MLGFKRKVIEMLQKKGYIISKDATNKSKFTIQKNKIEIAMNFSNEGTALLQYFTKTKVNLKDFFDNGNSDTEILQTVADFFDTIAKVQKIETKIDKKQTEITKLKEEILNIYSFEV